jgi:hypothetical protein
MADHNAANYRPRLAPTEKVEMGGESLIKVTAEVSSSVTADQINHLLKALADNSRFIAIERFGYAPQRGGQFDMMVSAYFLMVEAAPTAASVQQGNEDVAR